VRTQRQIDRHRHVKRRQAQSRDVLLVAVLTWLSASLEVSHGQTAATGGAANEVRIESVERDGIIEVLTPDSRDWVLTKIGQVLRPGYRVRTGLNTRAVLRWSDQSVVPMDALTELEILAPDEPKSLFGLNLLRGIISFFHRDQPGRIRVITKGAAAGIKGTEFVIEVSTNGPVERTTLSVIDGLVQFTNAFGSQELRNNQESVAEVGRAPSPPVGFSANNRLQWCFYYPGILDLRDLPLTPAEETILAPSLRAYRLGNLLGALRLYPAGRTAGSDAERLYYAALLLSVGRVSDTERALAALPAAPATDRIQRLAAALRLLIAVVKTDPNRSALYSQLSTPQLSTEQMAASYYEQSLAVREESLKAALKFARQAVTNSPDFGFAWERVAELEFSFGRIDRADEAFEKSYALSPQNAEARSLEGFLLAARNKTRQAIEWFNYAIEADSSLGNAWLGRGLCRIRRGDLQGGREDLLVAAALEPQRALLRSYLGKAYGEQGDYQRAAKELDRAKYLDPKDPTAWLYSALLNEQHNRINEAIRDLEQSQELNENRSVYRSALLLDKDQAVRSANLAAIYSDAGMFDVSVREASKAVSYDYANYSAHLFLANSYEQLADPKEINLRYETPTEVEFLLANLLAPADAGPLSPAISQQEYSRLFERNRVGVVSSTEYTSRGDWEQSGAQYGTIGGTGYSIEGLYRTENGERPNNDLEQRQVSVLLKQQLSPKDSVLLEAIDAERTGGDLLQYYDQSSAAVDFRFREIQEPVLLLGYHREWSPGIHTLFLVTRLKDQYSFTNSAQSTLLGLTPGGRLRGVDIVNMHEQFTGGVEIYTGELQQIWQQHSHTTIVGTRFQYGHFDTANLQNIPSAFFFAFSNPAADQDIHSLFKRLSFYGYHSWQLADELQVIGGLSYDQVTFPENFRSAPLSNAEQTAERVSPKAGLVFTPARNTTLRFAYTRSLSGATLDQSFQLEPPQVAGFLQSFRSIIPESVAGANSGALFETFDVSVEQKFPTGTYLAVGGEILNSEVNRFQGGFVTMPRNNRPFTVQSQFREDLSFGERSVFFTFNQLIGDRLSLGARYRLTSAELADDFVDVPTTINSLNFLRTQDLQGVLQRLDLSAIYNGASGAFLQFQALWNQQDNQGYTPDEVGDHFWQLNVLAGYRFPRRKAELMLGLLNLTDRDYHLNPLTLYQELPRHRTLAVQLQINF
jgi:tetratricopeptide (TPR) repeat protein